MVSEKLINELRVIIREDYGVELPKPTVAEIANTLVNYFEILSRVNCDVTE